MDTVLPPASDAQRRPPAPGRLELLRTFVNTVDLESGVDQFASPEQLAGWLTERALLPRGATIGAADRATVIAFREAVREVLEANAGHADASGALARLDEIAARVPLRLRMGDRPRLEPERGAGIDLAVGRLLAIIYEAVAQGTWSRLKACRDDACRWAFYDSSRNRSGVWCTMAICGNRTKGRVFRRRHPAETAAT